MLRMRNSKKAHSEKKRKHHHKLRGSSCRYHVLYFIRNSCNMIKNFIINYFIKKAMPENLFLAEWQTDILNPLLL